jgi:phosphoribosylformylglycinamidine cyclo-ligase
MPGLTYRSAGVDIKAGERLVDRIRPLAARTTIAEAIGGLGGFASLCAVPNDIREPVLVSGTDGVGTKLKVAFLADRHDTVGIDLVAMCVNDIVTTGARPLFFLDYFATGRLEIDRATRVVEGIAEGCRQAGCALLGGETAELPGMYAEDEYDLAGFAVGVVDRQSILTGERIEKGDAVIGVSSNGLHSNGYSLVRKVLIEKEGLGLDDRIEVLDEPLVESLLRPTRIYAKAASAALSTGGVRAFSHITGGGLPGNIPRVLPPGLGVELDPRSWSAAAIFELVANAGNIDEAEMRRTFNMGIGLIVIAAPDYADTVMKALEASGETAWRVGVVSKMPDQEGESRVRFI